MPPKPVKAIATNFSGGFLDATGLSYLECLFASALVVAANGKGFVTGAVLRARPPALEALRREVLGGHRGNDGEIDTHTVVSVARAPRDEVKQLVISGARLGPGDAHVRILNSHSET